MLWVKVQLADSVNGKRGKKWDHQGGYKQRARCLPFRQPKNHNIMRKIYQTSRFSDKNAFRSFRKQKEFLFPDISSTHRHMCIHGHIYQANKKKKSQRYQVLYWVLYSVIIITKISKRSAGQHCSAYATRSCSAAAAPKHAETLND